jgi:3-oxoadipate enol-lactonase
MPCGLPEPTRSKVPNPSVAALRRPAHIADHAFSGTDPHRTGATMTQHLERRDFFKMGLAAGGLTLAGTACGPVADASETSSPPEFTLYHEVYGEGPAVVFAHGAGGTHMSWWHQIPIFSREFMCVIYSQRGYGLSPDVPDGPGRAAFVEDLRGLLDELGIERAALVGQSMGGRSVLGFAAAYPERVTALVMASTTGGYTDPELDALRASAPDLGARSAYAAAYAERNPDGAFLYRMVSRSNQYLTPAAEDTGGSDAPMPDIARIVGGGVPTLFTVGERDTVAPPSVTKAMQAKMAGSRLVTFPESGHSTYWELPDEFNAVVLDFLRG